MKTLTRLACTRWLTGALLATAVATVACAGKTVPTVGTIVSNVDVTQASRQLNGDEWRAASFSAARVLKHVAQALDALAEKQNKVATENIDKSLTLVKILNSILPPTIVKTTISGAGLTYQDEDSVRPTFVPIYREYDQVDVLSPIAAQKKHTAVKNAMAKPKSALEYTYEGLDYTGIKMNLRLANRDLLLAQDLIEHNDAKAAMAALQDLEATGVIFEFSAMREPLFRAMDNLRLAESELKNKHPDQAKVALTGASDALRNYEKLAGDDRSKEVAKMHKEIEDVSKNIAGENGESFSKKVSGWWNELVDWYNK